MVTKRAHIATSMSCFLAVLAIAGCMHVDSTGPDGTSNRPDAPPPPGRQTSLDGSIPCGSTQCPSGTLCTHWFSGIDAGVPGNSESCEIVPASCRVSDCSGNTTVCPECIRELCSSAGYSNYVELDGRNLYCPGA